LKRKPMLFTRNIYSKNQAKKVIGLIGSNHGVGVTYTGMLLSHYFALEKRIKTAFLECNSHMDFERLQNVYEWSKEDEKSFSLDKITYYKQVSEKEVSEILSDDYGCFILDFGTDFNLWKDEFLRCGTKVVIGDRALWNQSKMADFLNLEGKIKGNMNWVYMIPLANKRELDEMSYKTDRKFIKLPYESDPTLLSKETIKLFKKLFG